ncbi:hypothetical protein Ddc_05205 [Ditylenchus destructor]|nr:hypothetical protein Ddc_05205 [Ditylenchus destructor]
MSSLMCGQRTVVDKPSLENSSVTENKSIFYAGMCTIIWHVVGSRLMEHNANNGYCETSNNLVTVEIVICTLLGRKWTQHLDVGSDHSQQYSLPFSSGRNATGQHCQAARHYNNSRHHPAGWLLPLFLAIVTSMLMELYDYEM